MTKLMGLIGCNLQEVRLRLREIELVTVQFDDGNGEVPRRWIRSRTEGFDIEYTAEEIACTVFIFVRGDEEHQPFGGEIAFGLSEVSQQDEVRRKLGTPQWSTASVTVPGLGEYGPADRYDRDELAIHFQYLIGPGQIELITVMARDQVPA